MGVADLYRDRASLGHLPVLPVGRVGWMGGWQYRKSITITHTDDGAQTDYQMKLTVNRSLGTDSAGTVYLGDHCKSDYSDLRFVKSDEGSLLDYWIEESTTATATIWVEFDSIPAHATDGSFWLYYGNTSATAATNGANTFYKFDDFERGADGDAIGGIWTTCNRSTISTDQCVHGSRSGKVPRPAGGDGEINFAQAAASHTYAIRFRVRAEAGSGSDKYLACWGNASDRTILAIQGTTPVFYYYDTTYRTLGVQGADTWFLFELNNIDFTAKTYDIYVDGTQKKSAAPMQAAAWSNGVLSFSNVSTTTQSNIWIEDFLMRKWTHNEPTWGAWGTEQSFLTFFNFA